MHCYCSEWKYNRRASAHCEPTLTEVDGHRASMSYGHIKGIVGLVSIRIGYGNQQRILLTLQTRGGVKKNYCLLLEPTQYVRAVALILE